MKKEDTAIKRSRAKNSGSMTMGKGGRRENPSNKKTELLVPKCKYLNCGIMQNVGGTDISFVNKHSLTDSNTNSKRQKSLPPNANYKIRS